MTQHTPGPWQTGIVLTEVRCNDGALEEVRTRDTMVCLVSTKPAGCKTPEQEERGAANARLIAAAPELLAALQETVRQFVPSRDKMTPLQKQAFDSARAALAKATGA